MDNSVHISDSRVLVVDDNPQNLQVVGNLLSPFGFHLQFILDSENVVEIASTERPDLILLDIQMPGIDGFEVCRRLQERNETRGIPVIFLTAAHKDEESIVRGFEVGGVDYVTKPFFRQELIARIRTHLQLKKYKEHLEALSVTDPLTGLFNRRRMNERMNEECARAKRHGSEYAIVICDIDHFKGVNDTYGHDCGDIVIQGVAEILRDSLREQDVVGRWGGEEFLIVLPETGSDGAVHLAEKLRGCIEAHVWSCGSTTFTLTMTLGVAICSSDGAPQDAVQRADVALYAGKEMGRNRVVQWDESL